jgi:anti-sigma B factor antagonist
MKITQEKCNDVTVCNVEGEINITTSTELRKNFDALLRDKVNKVIVDLTAVSYIDSSGLATLIELFQRLKKTGGHMRFTGMSQKIRNIFEITKLHKLFEICDTREAALQNF